MPSWPGPRPGARPLVAGGAVLGLALAAPAVVAPTYRLAIADPGRGVVIQAQEAFSWGATRIRLAGGRENLVDNVPGRVLFVAVLVVALVAVVAWAWRRGPAATLVGVAALAVATTRVVDSAVERLGRSSDIDRYALTGLDVRSYTPAAGAAENAAAVVLVLALAGVVVLSVRGLGPRPDDDGSEAGGGVGEEDSRDSSASSAVPGPRRAKGGGLQPPGRHLGGPEVGLSGEDPDR